MIKYRTINGWTKDRMKEHVMTEFKGKSMICVGSMEETCVYRGENNTKCAVGMFIPDILYSPMLEKITIYNMQEFQGVFPLDQMGLKAFQRIHDNSEPENTLHDLLSWINNCVED
jgi:hypothetical protein